MTASTVILNPYVVNIKMAFWTFLLLSLSIGITTNAQIRNHTLKFKNLEITYESVTANNKVEEFYILFFETDSSSSLKYMEAHKCLNQQASYYLMNVANMSLNNQDKNDLLEQFVKTINLDSKPPDATLYLVSKIERASVPILKNRKGLHIFVTESIEPICWQANAENKELIAE